MKLYCIYSTIPFDYYYNYFYEITEFKKYKRTKSGDFVTIYAVTFSKKVAKQFMDNRKSSKMFTLIEKDIDESDYTRDNIIRDYGSYLLKERDFCIVPDKIINSEYKPNSNDYAHILCTNFEYKACVYPDDYDANVEDTVMSQLSGLLKYQSDYMVFKDKYIRALDFLQYTTVYDMNYGGLIDEELYDSQHYEYNRDARAELAGSNRCYNMTVNGNEYMLNCYNFSQFGRFMVIFGFMFLEREK